MGIENNNNMRRCASIFLLNLRVMHRYTVTNIVATPLQNAQPWRLFLLLHPQGKERACL